MRNYIRDRKTESFYKINKVAEEYEMIRFEHPAGKLIDAFQKETILKCVNPLNLKGKYILDVASGTGRFSRLFQSLGAKVVAFDLSRAMLNQCRVRGSAEAYIEGNALHLPFKKEIFDLAISVNAFNHLPAFREAIDEICRVSKKVILGLPHKHSLLFMNTVYRVLRGWGYEYTRHKTQRYQGAPLIYTRYFSEKELKRSFEKNGFMVTGCFKCWVFPFPRVPKILIKPVQMVEKVSHRFLSSWGSFMAIVAERRL